MSPKKYATEFLSSLSHSDQFSKFFHRHTTLQEICNGVIVKDITKTAEVSGFFWSSKAFSCSLTDAVIDSTDRVIRIGDRVDVVSLQKWLFVALDWVLLVALWARCCQCVEYSLTQVHISLFLKCSLRCCLSSRRPTTSVQWWLSGR